MDNPQASNGNQSKVLPLLIRLTWTAFGNLVPIICVFLIVMEQGHSFHVRDVVFWASIVGLALVRYVDIAVFKGDTAEGQPASMRHFRNYALGLLGAALATWAAAHLFSFYVTA